MFSCPHLQIAQQYRAWYLSSPFDIGNTCRCAFSGRSRDEVAEDIMARACPFLVAFVVACVAVVVTAAVQSLRSNMESKANGAMMRASPFGIWAHRCARLFTATTTPLKWLSLGVVAERRAGWVMQPSSTCAGASAA
jgi:hypothetical protein